MEGQEKKTQLFREKSLETIESPESLNDYLRVTSPGVWLVMAAVIALLIGGILWGVFGSIDTTVQVAVAAEGGQAVCYVPYNSLQQVMATGEITVENQNYPLRQTADLGVTVVSEEMNPYLRVTGGLEVGDVTVAVPFASDRLPDGVYAGTVVTERLRPMSLLLK